MSVIIESKRKYSLSELDSMRTNVKLILIYTGRSGDAATVEEVLRTHMFNGTEPEELEKASDVAYEEYVKDD